MFKKLTHFFFIIGGADYSKIAPPHSFINAKVILSIIIFILWMLKKNITIFREQESIKQPKTFIPSFIHLNHENNNFSLSIPYKM